MFLACSGDEEPSCAETKITFKLNGEEQVLSSGSRGISINPDWTTHNLYLSASGSSTTYSFQRIFIETQYKRKGRNVIDRFNYEIYIDDVKYEMDFTDHDFKNRVIANGKTCFYATFSGKATTSGDMNW
ncbi:hypothetical protein DCC35_10975 [Mangrovivirga cuniculi]|uniref:Uncharacterized protein n=1 Tax=Mangrovivirga cuniculi TaxID=2715131 RepID=A0A4D7JHX5_9BACT|nr:hypothetical protein DCC35_10975 [Mangrovivirga cuniculi]